MLLWCTNHSSLDTFLKNKFIFVNVSCNVFCLISLSQILPAHPLPTNHQNLYSFCLKRKQKYKHRHKQKKTKQKQHTKEKNYPTKQTMESTSYWPTISEHSLECGCHSTVKKTLIVHLPIVINCKYVLRGETWCRLLYFHAGVYLVWTCAGLVYAVTLSESSYLNQTCCVCKMWFLWNYSPPQTLTTFPPPLPHRSLSPEAIC